jgi:hypothetical protein
MSCCPDYPYCPGRHYENHTDKQGHNCPMSGQPIGTSR